MTTTDKAGQFLIGGLPAGDYHVVALDGFQRGAERDVDTLRPLASRSVTLHLAEGESKSISLKVVER
jgi:aspartate/tyrosine/aromatic aminotransferase